MAFDPDSFRHAGHQLRPMTTAWAEPLGARLAAIDPWLKLGYSAATLARYLAADTPQRLALAVLDGDRPAACLTIRPDWLRGPLLELLAVLPDSQGIGLGQALIDWLVLETRQQSQYNLWTIGSAFNESALAFYRRQGFEQVGTLPGLIMAAESEVLLRLRIKLE
ncbi:MAG: GNAT family N-acetyltransferase [Candidatus Methylumidiphilus sp.]